MVSQSNASSFPISRPSCWSCLGRGVIQRSSPRKEGFCLGTGGSWLRAWWRGRDRSWTKKSEASGPKASSDLVGSGSVSLSQDVRVVHFFVSASFHPDSTSSSFSAAKYNPSAYPLGRVFIDGWVFETLDPYTKENYAIPSTRVTRVVAVNHQGSIPVAVNSMVNAGMARAVGAVEVCLKGTSPLLVVRFPGAVVV